MATEQGALQEEDYNSASDEEFNPDAPKPEIDEGASSSSDDDDDDAEQPATTKTKARKQPAEDLDFDNSGDEATISRGKRKRQKTSSKSKDGDDDDEEGGEGGLVKTRAQRRAEVQVKKPVAQTGKVSVNVEDLWTQMLAPQKLPSGPTANTGSNNLDEQTAEAKRDSGISPPSKDTQSGPETGTDTVASTLTSTNEPPLVSKEPNGEATITIKRSYEFAGQKMEEERVVLASSAEAKLYLQEQATKTLDSSKGPLPPLRRPKKRVSMFDSVEGGPGSPSSGLAGKGSKLNTLQKSKLDWAAHVDQEGISDELDEHRRAKDGYLGRMDFLGRMEAKREDDLRSVRPK